MPCVEVMADIYISQHNKETGTRTQRYLHTHKHAHINTYTATETSREHEESNGENTKMNICILMERKYFDTWK